MSIIEDKKYCPNCHKENCTCEKEINDFNSKYGKFRRNLILIRSRFRRKEFFKFFMFFIGFIIGFSLMNVFFNVLINLQNEKVSNATIAIILISVYIIEKIWNFTFEMFKSIINLTCEILGFRPIFWQDFILTTNDLTEDEFDERM